MGGHPFAGDSVGESAVRDTSTEGAPSGDRSLKNSTPSWPFKERGILRTQPLVRILLTKGKPFLEEYEPFGSGAQPAHLYKHAIA